MVGEVLGIMIARDMGEEEQGVAHSRREEKVVQQNNGGIVLKEATPQQI